MVGTAALPHILMRYYTTPSVKEARISVGWSLFFIFLLYFTAPALAILVKYEVYSNVIGSQFASLPGWVANWAAVDKTLMSVTDFNGDGIVQLAELTIETWRGRDDISVLVGGLAMGRTVRAALDQPGPTQRNVWAEPVGADWS